MSPVNIKHYYDDPIKSKKPNSTNCGRILVILVPMEFFLRCWLIGQKVFPDESALIGSGSCVEKVTFAIQPTSVLHDFVDDWRPDTLTSQAKNVQRARFDDLITGHLSSTIWVWVNTYRYIFSGMNIHLPAILGFTRYQGFDPSPYGYKR